MDLGELWVNVDYCVPLSKSDAVDAFSIFESELSPSGLRFETGREAVMYFTVGPDFVGFAVHLLSEPPVRDAIAGATGYAAVKFLDALAGEAAKAIVGRITNTGKKCFGNIFRRLKERFPQRHPVILVYVHFWFYLPDEGPSRAMVAYRLPEEDADEAFSQLPLDLYGPHSGWGKASFRNGRWERSGPER
jgi:hypothetical protein